MARTFFLRSGVALVLISGGAAAAEPVPAAPAPAAAPAAAAAPAPAAPSAVSADYVVDAGRVVAVQGEARTVLSIPEPVLAVHREGKRLRVARGPAGVAVYDVTEPLAPRLVGAMATAGSTTGFHEVDGQVWVVVVQKSAVPLESGSGAALRVDGLPPVATPPRAPAPPRAVRSHDAQVSIDIIRVGLGTVQLDAGKEHGLRVGDLLIVYRDKSVDADAPGEFTGEERVGTIEVTAVKDETALADTGRGTLPRVGDRVRRAKPSEDAALAFPPHAADLGEVSAVLRPIVNAGRPLGVGFLAELEGSYWTNAYFAGVRIHPLGLGWTDRGSVVATSALLEGGYEGHALSVGLGAGLSWVNGDLDHMLESFGGSADSGSASEGPTREETQETNTAFTLSQQARLGARDGLNLWIHNLLLLHEDSETEESGFIYGGTTARLTIPLEGRSDLFLDGGAGLMGYWFVGLGMSTWIRGNGAPGSWRLSVSAGAAGIRGSTEVTDTYPNGAEDTYQDDIDVAGPMVSLGLARRFEF